MPFVYGVNVPAELTSNATPGTATDALMVAVGSTRNVGVQSMWAQGKAAGLTTLSGLLFRLLRFTTASTSGTSITPAPRDPGMQAAKATAAYSPTAGSGGAAIQVGFGCGASGPGGWVATNPDSVPVLEAASGDSLDMHSYSGTASLKYECGMEIVE